MSDVFSSSKRSEIMSAVRSKGNKSTELSLASAFRKNSITGWRRNYDIFGRPDFVFLKYKIAIFVDGCFWHGHNCRNLKPKRHAAYWKAKRQKNRIRDRIVNMKLKQKGWKVIRLWECDVKNRSFKKLSNISKALQDV